MRANLRILSHKNLNYFFSLDREDFNRVIRPNPSLLSEIERTSIERFDRMRFVEQEYRRRMSIGFDAFPVVSDSNYDGVRMEHVTFCNAH